MTLGNTQITFYCIQNVVLKIFKDLYAIKKGEKKKKGKLESFVRNKLDFYVFYWSAHVSQIVFIKALFSPFESGMER